MKRHPDIAGPVRNMKLGDLFSAKRKPILMAAAAILVALAGLQLGKAFFNGDAEIVGGQSSRPRSPSRPSRPPVAAADAEAPAPQVEAARPAEGAAAGTTATGGSVRGQHRRLPISPRSRRRPKWPTPATARRCCPGRQ